jgi:sugar lactone lactonase YvrE
MKKVYLIMAVISLLVGKFILFAQDSSYKQIFTIGKKGDGDGEFRAPKDVAVDKDSNVYVIDYARKNVQKFNNKGRFIKKWQTKKAPLAITVDKKGNIWVAEEGLVEKFNPEGKRLISWGKMGRGKDEFSQPAGIAVSKKFVYISDPRGRRIQKFTHKGKFVSSISGMYPCCGILGIDIDNKGNLVVAHLIKFQVEVYDNKDRLIKKFGKKGGKEGFCGCCNPVGVCVDAKGNFYTTEKTIPRVKKFSPKGKFLETFGADVITRGCTRIEIAVDAKGKHVYVVDTRKAIIRVFGRKK